MKISYTTDAFIELVQLINFIESKNTAGAGLRWLSKFELFLIENTKTTKLIPLCNNATFRALALHCINYSDWIIACSIHGNELQIEAILHQSRIAD